jgi:hypothetical protein
LESTCPKRRFSCAIDAALLPPEPIFSTNPWSVIHPEHIGYFERSTLRRMASAETGLREIRIEANNIAPSTLVAWLRRRSTQNARMAAEVHRETRRGLDQRVRRALHQSRVLSASKRMLNHAISRTGLGDTLVAWLQKPSA